VTEAQGEVEESMYLSPFNHPC